MNFDLNEDEEMLKALAERFVSDHYDGAKRQMAVAQQQGFCSKNWAMLGELGLIAAAFRSENGGIGASPPDLALIFEALGKGLAVEPMIESAVLAGGLFEHSADETLLAAWMADLLEGKRRLALAHHERNARQNLAWVDTTAHNKDDGWTLTGAKALVVAGVGADAFIVSARASGTADARDGIALFLVAAGAEGLTLEPYRLSDGTMACALTLAHTPATMLRGGLDVLEDAFARAAITRCAEALGIMELLFATTLDYLRTRKQFGTPLGQFQAIQHRMVRQYANLEQARALLTIATMADPADRPHWLQAIAGARAFISEVSVALGHEAIQLHGGMGVSDELIVGHAHKRLMMLSRYPETAETALDAYAGVVR